MCVSHFYAIRHKKNFGDILFQIYTKVLINEVKSNFVNGDGMSFYKNLFDYHKIFPSNIYCILSVGCNIAYLSFILPF